MAEDFLVSIGVSELFLSYQKTIFDVQPRNYKFKVKLLSFPVVRESCLFFKDRSSQYKFNEARVIISFVQKL